MVQIVWPETYKDGSPGLVIAVGDSKLRICGTSHYQDDSFLH